jgi:hypothetical protein
MTIKDKKPKKDKDMAFDLFAQSVRLYCALFCKKHHLEAPMWIGDHLGTVGSFGDYVIDFETVRYDIDNNIPDGVLFEWYDFNQDKYYSHDKKTVNYDYFVTAIKGIYGDSDL